MEKLFCSIYKSAKKEGAYLYLEKGKEISSVPEALLSLFGPPKLFTHMILDENKKLARADVKAVIKEVRTKGFFLQMPEPIEDYRRKLASKEK